MLSIGIVLSLGRYVYTARLVDQDQETEMSTAPNRCRDALLYSTFINL